jgi:hypothetical protein
MISFFAFALTHHFEWWLPDFPPEVVSNTTSMPVNELSEEHGSEDEIHKPVSETSVSDGFADRYGSHFSNLHILYKKIPVPPPDKA